MHLGSGLNPGSWALYSRFTNTSKHPHWLCRCFNSHARSWSGLDSAPSEETCAGITTDWVLLLLPNQQHRPQSTCKNHNITLVFHWLQFRLFLLSDWSFADALFTFRHFPLAFRLGYSRTLTWWFARVLYSKLRLQYKTSSWHFTISWQHSHMQKTMQMCNGLTAIFQVNLGG